MPTTDLALDSIMRQREGETEGQAAWDSGGLTCLLAEALEQRNGKERYNLVESMDLGPEETSTSDNTPSSHMFTLKCSGSVKSYLQTKPHSSPSHWLTS